MPSLLNKTVVAVATMNNPLPFAIGYCCVGNFTEMMELGVGDVIISQYIERKSDRDCSFLW